MSSAETDGFAAGFLDDYFAECDEHLTAIRHALLTLEAGMADHRVDGPALEQLFRSFHSIKGLSGMVELREAERLAHELESYLRAIRQSEAALTTDGIAALFDATTVLGRVIAARREGTEPSAGNTAVERLHEALLAGSGPVTGTPATGPSVSRRRWRGRYVPLPELMERGVNVNSVRERLQALGEIVRAVPHVDGRGGISFEFVLQTSPDVTLGMLPSDGLAWEAYDEREVAAAASGPGAGIEPMGRPSLVAPSHVIRVDLTRLDDLMRIIGDLVIARARLTDTLGRVERHLPAPEWRAVQDSSAAVERHVRDLRDGVMRVRLVPIGELFERMVFVVRDLAREAGRRVRLDLRGKSTEIDKFLIERMMDPLLHLVRNAVTHGLESAEERRASNKPEEATVTLRASTSGDLVVIEVEDDGRGIDGERVAACARAAGLAPGDGPLDAAALLDLICSPGLSTRDEVDRGSGRGVGMAVVRRAVQDVGGTLTLETEAGRGTRFTMQLPLTLAITEAVIVTVGDRTFAVPQGAVAEVFDVDPAVIRRLECSEIAPYRNGVLPLLRLARLFGLPETPRPRHHVFVVGTGGTAVGIMVDRILGQKEIVVRTFTDALVKVNGVSGATELGDGRVVLILDAAALARQGHARSPR